MKTTALRVDPELSFMDLRIDPLTLSETVGLAALGLYHLLTRMHESADAAGLPQSPAQKARLVDLRNCLPPMISKLLDNPTDIMNAVMVLKLAHKNVELSDFIRTTIESTKS